MTAARVDFSDLEAALDGLGRTQRHFMCLAFAGLRNKQAAAGNPSIAAVYHALACALRDSTDVEDAKLRALFDDTSGGLS